MSYKRIAACAAGLLVAGTSLGIAKAGNDALPNPGAHISLSAAVTAAEQHVNGKAVRAEYERGKDGNWFYDVEVTAGFQVFDVKVDADKGTVIGSTEDTTDDDDAGDEVD